MPVVGVVAAVFLLAGCAGLDIKPGKTAHTGRHTPSGPGLFSGEKGAFVIHGAAQETEDRDGTSLQQKPAGQRILVKPRKTPSN